jgi:hypothetical protein
MNDLSDAYGYYSSIDELLKSINGSKKKSLSRASIKKNAYWNKVIELALVHQFVFLSEVKGKQLITLTEKGNKHIIEGGFETVICLEEKKVPQKTFKQFLDDLVGLLTIFGILNAITIFATQIELPKSSKQFGFDITGKQLISISMYVLSLLVLVEIILVTLKDARKDIKFQILYFLLCMTTLGIGLIFLTQFKEFFFGLGFIAAFFGLTWIVFLIIMKLLQHLITQKNVIWVKRNITKITMILVLISLITSGIVLKLLVRWLFVK